MYNHDCNQTTSEFNWQHSSAMPPSPPPLGELRTPNQEEQRDYEKGIKVFGSQAALTIVKTKSRQEFSTITIEAAAAVGPKNYDWKQKVAIQLTRTELPRVIGVFLGVTQAGLTFNNHGIQNNKSLEVRLQDLPRRGKSIFVSVRGAGAGARGVPVPLDEALLIGYYMLDSFLDNYQNLSADIVLRTIGIMEHHIANSSAANLNR